MESRLVSVGGGRFGSQETDGGSPGWLGGVDFAAGWSMGSDVGKAGGEAGDGVAADGLVAASWAGDAVDEAQGAVGGARFSGCC